MAEETLGMIDGVRGKEPSGHWTLFVTSDRIFAASVGKTGVGAAFEVGGILLAKSRAKRRTEKLRHQPPNQVLKTHRKNFAIPYETVQVAELDDPEVVVSGTLHITTEAGEYAFHLQDEAHYKEHVALLRAGLKDKLQIE